MSMYKNLLTITDHDGAILELYTPMMAENAKKFIGVHANDDESVLLVNRQQAEQIIFTLKEYFGLESERNL